MTNANRQFCTLILGNRIFKTAQFLSSLLNIYLLNIEPKCVLKNEGGWAMLTSARGRGYADADRGGEGV